MRFIAKTRCAREILYLCRSYNRITKLKYHTELWQTAYPDAHIQDRSQT